MFQGLTNLTGSSLIDLSAQYPFQNVSINDSDPNVLVGIKIGLGAAGGFGSLTVIGDDGKPIDISKWNNSSYCNTSTGFTYDWKKVYGGNIDEANLWSQAITGAILYYVPDAVTPYYQIVGTAAAVNDLLQKKLMYAKPDNTLINLSTPLSVSGGECASCDGSMWKDISNPSEPAQTISPQATWSEQAPVVTLAANKIAINPGSVSQVFSSQGKAKATVSDNNYYDAITVTIMVVSGRLNYLDTNGITHNYTSSSTPLTLSGTNATAVQNQLQALAITADSETVLLITATDAEGGNAVAQQLTIHNNQAPTFSQTGGTAAYTLGGAGVALFGGTTFNDDPISNNEMDTLTVSISGSATSGDSIASAGLGSYNSTTHMYIYTGTVSQIQDVLNNLTFTATALGSGARTISMFLTDSLGVSSAPILETVNVNEPYVAPGISGTGTEIDCNDNVGTIDPFHNVVITGSGAMTVTLTIPHGFSFQAVDSDNSCPNVTETTSSNTITLTGTSQDITTYLQGGKIQVSIPENTISIGTREIDYFDISATNSGSGTATASQTVKITPVDDTPQVTLRNFVITKDIKDSETVRLIANGATVTDPDADDTETVKVQLKGAILSGDQLKLAAGSGMTGNVGTYDSTTETYTCSNLTASQASTLLTNLEFVPQASANPRLVTYDVTVTDSQNQSVTQSDVASFSITHDSTHDLKIISVTNALEITDSAPATNIFSGIQLSGGSANSSLTISNGDRAMGVFSLASGASFQSQVSIDPQGVLLSLKGTGAQIQADLHGGKVIFTPAANLVSVTRASNDTFTLTSSETAASSSMTVRITSVNDAPVLGNITATQSVQNTGTLALCPQATLTDPDVQETEALTVTVMGEGTINASQAANTSTTTGGATTYTWNSMPVAVAQTLLRSLVYQPVVGQTSAATVKIQTKDSWQTLSNAANVAVNVTAASSGGSGGVNVGQTVTYSNSPSINVDGQYTATLDASGDSSGVVIYEGGGYSHFEQIIGGSGSDDIRGDGTTATIEGGAGNDQIWTGNVVAAGVLAGNAATVSGGVGDDVIWAGVHEGTVAVSYDGQASSGDTIEAYTVSAYDFVGTRDQHVSVNNRTGDVTIYTSSDRNGTSELILEGAALHPGVAVQHFVSSEGWNFNMLFSSESGQSLLGSANEIDNLYAVTGSSATLGDTLDGGGGDDNLYGGSGADTFVYHDGDKIYGGAGHDTIDATRQTGPVRIHLDDTSYLVTDDSSDGTGDGLDIEGSQTASNDLRGATHLSGTLVGGAVGDYLWSGKGNKADRLVGNGGADEFYYGLNEGNDVIAAGQTAATGTVNGTVDFYNITDPDGVLVSLQGNDLVVTMVGGAGSLKIEDWNGSDQYNHLTHFTFGMGATAQQYVLSLSSDGKAQWNKQ